MALVHGEQEGTVLDLFRAAGDRLIYTFPPRRCMEASCHYPSVEHVAFVMGGT